MTLTAKPFALPASVSRGVQPTSQSSTAASAAAVYLGQYCTYKRWYQQVDPRSTPSLPSSVIVDGRGVVLFGQCLRSPVTGWLHGYTASLSMLHFVTIQ